MLENKELVSLNNLGEGAAAELFDLELHRVLDNIQDVNTKATTKRVITLKVTIQPDEHRNFGVTEIASSCKLAAVKPYPTQLVFGQESPGKFVATEYNPKQSDLFPQPKPGENVVKILRRPRMIKEGIEKILSLAPVQQLTIDGREYTD